jgi:catechol 2,3-dioxygenase-like lactoylglutathione lyase family enzyme
MIVSIDHVQLAMPPGGEPEARDFYVVVLGLEEVAKPAELAARGGCWFENATVHVHLGVESQFEPARKAHPAFRVTELTALLARARDRGVRVYDEAQLDGEHRAYLDDPFGNRIELIEVL